MDSSLLTRGCGCPGSGAMGRAWEGTAAENSWSSVDSSLLARGCGCPGFVIISRHNGAYILLLWQHLLSGVDDEGLAIGSWVRVDLPSLGRVA